MFNRMTVWTQNNKISWRIIMSISIFMMDSKNFCINRISALLAFRNHISSYHVFSYIRRMGQRMFLFFVFGKAFFRTIFSIFSTIRRSFKLLFAVFAYQFYSSVPELPFMITFTRTVLGFSLSCGNVLKNISTNYTIIRKTLSCVIAHTFMGAKFSGIKTVRRNIKAFSASKAVNCFACFSVIHKGAPYAIEIW